MTQTEVLDDQSQFVSVINDGSLDPQVRADASYAAARHLLQGGQPVEALERIAEARDLYIEAKQPVAALRTDLGRVNVLDDLGRHREAAEVGARMIHALEEADFDESDLPLREWLYAAALENQGACMGWLGQHDAAAQLLAQSLEAYAGAGSSEDLARVQANLGVEQLELGNLDKALTLLARAEKDLADNGQSDLARRCSVYAAQAEALAGRYGRALERLPIADTDQDVELHDIDEVRLLIARAEVYCVMHLWPEAARLTRQLEKVTSAAEMHRDLATVWVLIARTHIGLGERDEAAKVATQAIALLDELGLPARAARARLALAEALPVENALDEVRTAYRAFDDVGEPWGLAASSVLGAELANSSEARNAWARAAIECDAAAYPELKWRLETVLGQIARAVGRSEAAARHFEEALHGLRSTRGTIDGELHRLPFMSDRRTPLEALVSMELEAGNVAAARYYSTSERAWLTANVDEPVEPSPGTVMYQSIDGKVSAFVTTDDGTVHVNLDATVDSLAKAKRALQSHWRRIADPRMRVHLDQLRPATEALLQELYLMLMAPIEPLLRPDAPITIIPVGSMSGIPFHAFHDGMSYLIERRLVYLAPSDHTQPANFAGPTLIVGVPDKLAPQIEREASQIAEVTGGTLLLGSDATRAAVRSAVTDHNVLHLACHGRFRADNAAMSALLLADGWFTAEALQHLDLHNKLVVLASCSSGLQRSMGEDEALGLPRAILAAGAGAVVMNLWPADDVASVGMMTHFHTNLKSADPTSALRAAQLMTMQSHPHPLLWGAPVVFGYPGNLKGDADEAA